MSQYAESTYIGDGVYAHWDGFSVRLSVNDHRNPPVVSLELDVMQSLIEYAEEKMQTNFKHGDNKRT